nr:ankyrin repeat and protein kinase domain-containing protein 1-like [Halyomorpha halys]
MADYREEIEKAVIYSDMDKVKAMLSEGDDINKRRGFKGITLLHIAPSVEITRQLIRLGAKVCVKNKQQQTALHYATMYQKELSIINELLANGADIMVEDCEGRTPLHYAVRNNVDSTAALQLISKGAKTTVLDIQNRSPLHYAAMNDRDLGLFKKLLVFGANVHGKDIIGRTPLHYAAINCTDHLPIHEMLRYGANPNEVDKRKRTPLHYVIVNCRMYTLAEELLKYGANVNVCDDHGYTPLYLASESEFKNLRAIQKLLEYGADINIGRDEYWPYYSYCTVLEKALFKRDLDCAKLLIKMTLLMNFDINNQKPIDLDRYIEYPDHNKLLNYQSGCLYELNRMVKETISNKFTLYKFLTMREEYKKPIYLNSLIQKQILTSYPLYKDIIMSRLQHCLIRANLLRKMEYVILGNSQSWCFRIDPILLSREVYLNLDCVYKICEYLSNQDLINCVAASLEYHDIR